MCLRTLVFLNANSRWTKARWHATRRPSVAVRSRKSLTWWTGSSLSETRYFPLKPPQFSSPISPKNDLFSTISTRIFPVSRVSLFLLRRINLLQCWPPAYQSSHLAIKPIRIWAFFLFFRILVKFPLISNLLSLYHQVKHLRMLLYFLLLFFFIL